MLLLVRDGGSSRATVSGVADGARGRPIRAGDRFRVGSVTKTFVAVVVLQLVAGSCGARRHGRGLLPGVVPGGQAITVRQLLAHTSGLYDYVDDARVFAPYAQDPAHAWSPRELVRIAVEHPAAFAPGERYAYSSTNYLLLGLIAEAATGRSIAEELPNARLRASA